MILAEASFGAEDFRALVNATDPQMADLEVYRAILTEWNERMNLVGPSAMPMFWLRHAWDSAQLRTIMPEASVWADVGAGAGFPGLVLAILMKQTPNAAVHLIESMAKRCRFLSHVIEQLGLPAKVHHARAETVALRHVEVVTARACAPMTRLLDLSWPLLRQGAPGLFLKGQGLGGELVEAKKVWSFQETVFPSRSDPSGAIVKIEGVARV